MALSSPPLATASKFVYVYADSKLLPDNGREFEVIDSGRGLGPGENVPRAVWNVCVVVVDRNDVGRSAGLSSCTISLNGSTTYPSMPMTPAAGIGSRRGGLACALASLRLLSLNLIRLRTPNDSVLERFTGDDDRAGVKRIGDLLIDALDTFLVLSELLATMHISFFRDEDQTHVRTYLDNHSHVSSAGPS